MTPSQRKQFNQMRIALIRIARVYMEPPQLRKAAARHGLDEDEMLEAAYDNIQADAASAVHGVRAIKEPTRA